VRRWRPLSPDIWQAPSAPDIPPTYMLTFPHLPQLVHICQSGPAWSCSFFFYYRPGPATERLVYQGRIKGILRQEVEANSPAMWRPLSDEVAKLHCLHILLVDKRVCLANNESSRNRNAKGFRDTYIESVAPYLLCFGDGGRGVKDGQGGQGVSGVSGRLQLISVSVVDKMCCHL